MDLVFDTTATGGGRAETTDKMVKRLKPHGPSGKQVPPLVEFGWGVYRFTGMVEQYKETLDFFAASGVPLRAGVNLTLSSQDVVFESNTNKPAKVDEDLTPEPVSVPTSTGPAGGPAGVANSLGDPRAARAIAAANGSGELRFRRRRSASGTEAGAAFGRRGVLGSRQRGFGLGISGGSARGFRRRGPLASRGGRRDWLSGRAVIGYAGAESARRRARRPGLPSAARECGAGLGHQAVPGTATGRRFRPARATTAVAGGPRAGWL